MNKTNSNKLVNHLDGEKTVFSTKEGEITGYPHTKKKNLHTDLTPFTKINAIWIIDLNVKCNIRKFLKDNIRKKIYN